MPKPLFDLHTTKAVDAFYRKIQNTHPTHAKPFLLGIGGPGGSGKSVLSAHLSDQWPDCQILALDEFRLPRVERPLHAPFGSHPDAIDQARLATTLDAAANGLPVVQPVFDRKQGDHSGRKRLPKASILLLDGELSAYALLAGYLHDLLLVESTLWQQFSSRMRRDRVQRSTHLVKALHIFWKSNLRDYPHFSKASSIKPSLRLFRGRDNQFHVLS